MPVTVNQTKNRFLLLFRQKQQNQWGPRTRISLAAIISRDVSAKSAPLPRCGARSDERIALRTTELLKASVSTRLLHAASVLAQTGAAPGKTRPPALFHFADSGRLSMQKPNRPILHWPYFGKVRNMELIPLSSLRGSLQTSPFEKGGKRGI